MINIFRRIRKDLWNRNSFGKYALYALGEIVLVVIGILIALAINTNEQYKANREKEQQYLVGLKEEFEISKLKLTELIQVNARNNQGAKKIISLITDTSTPVSERQFSEILVNTFSNDIAFNPNNALLTEMINSGSLKDISSVTLRIRLTNWISNLEDIAKQEDELGIQRRKVLDMFRNSEQSVRTVFDKTEVGHMLGLPKAAHSISNLNLLRATDFENNVLMFIITSHATETAHYAPLMNDLQNILDMIGKEIE